jgi:hypothetical protein
MANSSHAALGVWYKPRQCFCHAQHLRLTRLDSAVGIGVDYSGSLAIDGIDTGDHDQLKYLGTVCHRIA